MTTILDYDLVEDTEAFEKACREWASGLPDWMIRSFAYDYRNGDRDAATVDAWNEYRRRFGDKDPHNATSYRPKLLIRCEKHQTSRTPGACAICRQLNGLQPISRKRSKLS